MCCTYSSDKILTTLVMLMNLVCYFQRVGDVFVCQNFCAKHVEASFWEGFDLDKNPKVKLLLRGFSTHVHKLLQSHEGGLPLGR